MTRILKKILKKSKNYNIINIRDLIIPKFWKNFNDFKHTHQIYTSGRAGTKSSRGGIKAIKTIMRQETGSVVAIRKFHNKLEKTIFKECLRAINRLGAKKSEFIITKKPMRITCKATGNTIYFTGNDSIDDTKGMIDEDRPIVLVILDELTEFFDKGEGEDEIQNIEATFIRGNDDKFVMEYYFNPPKNPKAPIMKWLEAMKQRPDCIHVHVDYRDVPREWLGEKLIQSALILKELDEKQYNWLWLGLCTGIDELIYYMFNEDVHVYEPTEEDYKNIDYLFIGVDYGQMNATTYQSFGISFKKKCIFGIDEYYWSGREEGTQRAPSKYAEDFKTFVEKVESETKKKIRYVYIDPSAKGLQEEIKRVCPGITIKNAKNDVALGISRVQKVLTYKFIRISPRQEHLIGEMYLYKYDENLLDKGKEIPIKQDDHCQDALRYFIMGVWKYIKRLLPILEEDDEDGDDD